MSLPITTYDDPAVPVRAVRSTLRRKCPMELVFYIMGLADYHPVVRAQRKELVSISASNGIENCAAQLYLVSPPIPGGLPDESWRVRTVTWFVDGHDQGWGGDDPGRYSPAYSWYDACILRPQGPSPVDLDQIEGIEKVFRDPAKSQKLLEPNRWTLVQNAEAKFVWRLQGNRIAHGKFEQHEIVWTAEPTDEEVEAAKEHGASDGRGFVKTLKPGDRIGIWMRAVFPGWTNVLQEARIEVVYEVL